MFDKQIIDFGHYFKGRLDDTYLDGALDYVNHNEEPLAIETLCDHLVEYNIAITQQEYAELFLLLKNMGIDTDTGSYSYLKDLIK